MKDLIGCCGLDCEVCDARIATVNNDNDLKEKTAKLWTKLNGVEITPDMINCSGCRIAGAKTPFCDSLCRIRKCAISKNFSTCAECAEMDGCEILKTIVSNNESALKNLKDINQCF